MPSALDWDEFRLVKAIADARSLVGAAEALGLNHSTVFRRLAAIESAIGARLFERSRAGYRPTAAGEEMIGLASAMADSIIEFERRVAGRDVKPSGELRVTTTDSIAISLLPPILARFRAVNPGVQLDLIVAAQTLNLSRRDADVAIRTTNEPPEALVGRRICAMRWAVYCSARIAAEFGPRVVAAAPWVGFGDHYAPPLGKRWVEDNVGPRRQVARVNSVLGILEAAAIGVGAALLPCFLGDPRPELTRVGAVLPELDVDLWILTHADLRQSARVRAFMELGRRGARQDAQGDRRRRRRARLSARAGRGAIRSQGKIAARNVSAEFLTDRTHLCDNRRMRGQEFVRKIKKLGRQRGVLVAFDGAHGKGSHGRLYFGDRFTTLKDRSKEIGPGLLKAMLDQLGLQRDDIGE